MVPKLEKLKLHSINIERIWQLPKGSTFSMQNLTNLFIESCVNLTHILSHSMVEYLEQLEVLEIINCKRLQGIIAIEEITEDENRATFSFPHLKILRIEQCPELKQFILESMSNQITTCSSAEVALFSQKVD